jgi:AraC-like DNA-binding protein
MDVRQAAVESHLKSAEYVESLFVPEPPLDLMISNFYCFTASISAKTVVKSLSPNLEMMLVFNFGSSIRVSFGNEPFNEFKVEKYAIIGPIKKKLNYEIVPGAETIVVNFRLNGFHRLFNIPVFKLNSQMITNPETIVGKRIFTRLWDRLSILKDPQERINEMILQALPCIKPNTDQVTALLNGERFFYDPLLNPSKAIALETNLTERMIQMKFQEQVGYSPKELIRFLRFKQVVSKLIARNTEKLEVFEIITAQGYYDQSHLIKDFNHFLSTTPKKFFKSIKENVVCTTHDGIPN